MVKKKEKRGAERSITDLRHQLSEADYKLRHMGATIRHLITALDRLGVLTTFFTPTPTVEMEDGRQEEGKPVSFKMEDGRWVSKEEPNGK